MDLTPLVTAPPAVQWHVATILPAAVLGAVQLFRRKGTASHRVLGYFFVALMLGTCVSAYFIAGALTFLPGR